MCKTYSCQKLTRSELLHKGLAGAAALYGFGQVSAASAGPNDAPEQAGVPHEEPQVIDVHGHYGRFHGADPLRNQFMSCDAAGVQARAHRCGITTTIVSPLLALLPRGQADATDGNAEAARVLSGFAGLKQYVVVNPRQPATYEQAAAMLQNRQCVGIKIHPEEHGYAIRECGNELFRFLEEMNVPVLAHSGCPNSLPIDFVPWVERFPAVTLILAHIGHGGGDGNRVDLQIEALKKTAGAAVYADTSSASSMLAGLIEWAVDSVGSERILFGSDTPLYSVGAQLGRIRFANIAENDKANILYLNAQSVFGLRGQAERIDGRM